ncbi:diacylglycerol kinase 1 [Capsaspora owczarzaki ATCC 30864]|uniref:Diacylglycerol kinase n=1 Tax=Capsaspora owczarzaki (strain ATCC 30864) TaxID=595528 RepID=A0A0D2UP61_CAPO3|nr:diacylglycerol kinase 1 [Capsaspora owczarzaki ATCC 30864]KJE96781.1 diacylglycerol kinase 1 [Capsaspora owczarzaki ATCC 30864]|eukprot:XP_004343775.2 diacylglycerol kinase 1 [Capsaspora owczarzaki ATCC 30864]
MSSPSGQAAAAAATTSSGSGTLHPHMSQDHDALIEETLRRLQLENQHLREQLDLKQAAVAANLGAVNALGSEVSARLDEVKLTGPADRSTVQPPSAGEVVRGLLEGGQGGANSDLSFDFGLDLDESSLESIEHARAGGLLGAGGVPGLADAERVLDDEEEDEESDDEYEEEEVSLASSTDTIPPAQLADSNSSSSRLEREPGLQSVNFSSFLNNPEILSGLVDRFRRGFRADDGKDSAIAPASSVFTGQQVIDWLVRTVLITRRRALAVGQSMIDQGIIEQLDKSGKRVQSKDSRFYDDRTLYRYKNDDADFEFLEIKLEHTFVRKDKSKPVVCDVCRTRIWTGAMLVCESCKLRCHKNCEGRVTSICSRSESGVARPLPEEEHGAAAAAAAADLEEDSSMVVDEKEFNPIIIPNSAVRAVEPVSAGGNKYAITLPQDCTPVIVFVNRKSGGQEGGRLISILQRRLHECQIWDLGQGGPRPGLLQFREIAHKVLVCGGDGTVGWVLSEMDKIDYAPLQQPPVAILPMGTGNDLSRVLGWGPGGGARTMGYLSKKLFQMVHSEIVLLDRWSVAIHDVERNKNLLVMNNYLSVGVDAKIALKFHHAREESPERFKSKNLNKLWYVTYAAKAMLGSSLPVCDMVSLEVDGKPVVIQRDIEAVILLNIPSYMAGTDLWGKKAAPFVDQTFSDGLLEVVGITGVSHMGRIQAKVSTGRRLAQGSHVRFTLTHEIAAQIDGEPWLQKPGVIDIRLLNQARMLRFNKKERFHPDFVTINLTPQELEVIASDFVQGVPTYFRKVHHVGRKAYVFLGSEGVDWLMFYMKTDDRSKAWKVGQLLMEAGVFEHTGHHRQFRDQNVYYKFAENRVPLVTGHDGSTPTSPLQALVAGHHRGSASAAGGVPSGSGAAAAAAAAGVTAESSASASTSAPVSASASASASSFFEPPESSTAMLQLTSLTVNSLSITDIGDFLREAVASLPAADRALAVQFVDEGSSADLSPIAQRDRRRLLAMAAELNPDLRAKLEARLTGHFGLETAEAPSYSSKIASYSTASASASFHEDKPENFLAHLKVFVVEAKELRALDSNCDAYLVCDCEKETFKSRVVRRTTNPAFGEEFHFIISRSNSMLNFAVYDHNRSAQVMAVDEAFLGRLKVPISSLEPGVVDKWFHLLPKKDKHVGIRPKGSIHLIMEYTPLLGTVDSGMSLGPEPFVPPGEPVGGFKSVIARVSEANHVSCAFNNIYHPLAENEHEQALLRMTSGKNKADDDILPEFELVSSVAMAEGLFEYFSAPMRSEDVDVYVQRDQRVISDEWMHIGTFRTDMAGRVFVPMPKWVHSTVAHYRIRMVALHDHSIAAGSLYVVPKGTACIVYDIDGTLTIGDQEVVQQAVKDAVNVSYDLKLRKGALSLVRMWFAKGYMPVYLSGRAGSFYNLTRDWLIRHGFPPGPILHTRSHLPTVPLYPSVGVFKRDWISHLKAIGLDVVAAYGNTETDIRAYGEFGLPRNRILIVGPHAGNGGSVNCGRSNFKDHLQDVVHFPEAAIPVPRESMDW